MKDSIRRRKMFALGLLEEQLIKGKKPISKGDKPYETSESDGVTSVNYRKNKDGSFKLDDQNRRIPVLMDVVDLSPSEIARKKIEVANLKRKLKIA